MKNLKEGWVVIVKTNQYAGNFERGLTAHCTGHIGDCGVGEEYIEENISSIFEDIIQQCPDEHACYRPCQITNVEKDHTEIPYPNVAIFFNERPNNEQLALIKQRALTFHEKRKKLDRFYEEKNYIKIEGFSLLSVSQIVNKEDI